MDVSCQSRPPDTKTSIAVRRPTHMQLPTTSASTRWFVCFPARACGHCPHLLPKLNCLDSQFAGEKSSRGSFGIISFKSRPLEPATPLHLLNPTALLLCLRAKRILVEVSSVCLCCPLESTDQRSQAHQTLVARSSQRSSTTSRSPWPSTFLQLPTSHCYSPPLKGVEPSLTIRDETTAHATS